MPTRPSKQLETFDNPHPERDYIIEIETPEFTCLCPKTGQPDFASITIQYVPDEKCVELKSLKLYYWAYRDEGAFHEKVTNTILDDLVEITQPRYMLVTAIFNVRGGIYTTVHAEYRKPGWVSLPPVPGHLETDVQTLPTERDLPSQPTEPELTGVRGSELQSPSARASLPPEVDPGEVIEEIVAPPPPLEPSPQGSQHQALDQETTRPRTTGPDQPIFLGLDIGTSGVRIVAIDEQGTQLSQAEVPISAPARRDREVTQDADYWWQATSTCLDRIFQSVNPRQIHTLAIDGTSGTILVADKNGTPLTPALMYNDSRAQQQAAAIGKAASKASGAHGATSGLAKLLWLQGQAVGQQAAYALHQADWLTGKLTGRWGVSDYNNAMKLGYDTERGEWPGWLDKLKVNRALLPEVVAPGELVGTLSNEIALSFGMNENTRVVGGTTDGVAAFLAAGALKPGHAVTSLGTTLVLKLLSETPVFDPDRGVYSHRLGKYWLAGGASNSGGAVLLQYFKVEQMREMTIMLDPENLTGLDYYPLPAVGERFPINDPGMIARLEPLPGDSVVFFQAILEGIANIEAQGYRVLSELGAPKVKEIRTTGGGSQNKAWEKIRGKIIGATMTQARSELAAYGTALLAKGIIQEKFS